MVVELCAPRTHSPYFTFIPMGKLVLTYARSSGMRPSRERQPHCNNKSDQVRFLTDPCHVISFVCRGDQAPVH